MSEAKWHQGTPHGSGQWRRMESSFGLREPVCWVVKEGQQAWSVNAQKGEAEHLATYLNSLEAEIADLRADTERLLADWEAGTKMLTTLRAAFIKEEYEIQQTLGKALGYPWVKDDQKNFPGATEADGVVVGPHVAATLALEAADLIATLRAKAALADKLYASLKRRPTNSEQWLYRFERDYDALSHSQEEQSE